jgi:hypothetical protein
LKSIEKRAKEARRSQERFVSKEPSVEVVKRGETLPSVRQHEEVTKPVADSDSTSAIELKRVEPSTLAVSKQSTLTAKATINIFQSEEEERPPAAVKPFEISGFKR